MISISEEIQFSRNTEHIFTKLLCYGNVGIYIYIETGCLFSHVLSRPKATVKLIDQKLFMHFQLLINQFDRLGQGFPFIFIIRTYEKFATNLVPHKIHFALEDKLSEHQGHWDSMFYFQSTLLCASLYIHSENRVK